MIKRLINSFSVLLSVFSFRNWHKIWLKKRDWITVIVKKIFQISNFFLEEIVRSTGNFCSIEKTHNKTFFPNFGTKSIEI